MIKTVRSHWRLSSWRLSNKEQVNKKMTTWDYTVQQGVLGDDFSQSVNSRLIVSNFSALYCTLLIPQSPPLIYKLLLNQLIFSAIFWIAYTPSLLLQERFEKGNFRKTYRWNQCCDPTRTSCWSSPFQYTLALLLCKSTKTTWLALGNRGKRHKKLFRHRNVVVPGEAARVLK